jgi:hypothetical protein
MKAEDVAAARINLTLRHKKTGKVYRTILNSNGFSWMQVRNGKLVVNATVSQWPPVRPDPADRP